MNIGDLYAWTTPNYAVLDAGKVLELRDDGKSVLVNILFPEDAGELRQVGLDKGYSKRAEQILRSKSGERIGKARRQLLKIVLEGSKKR